MSDGILQLIHTPEDTVAKINATLEVKKIEPDLAWGTLASVTGLPSFDIKLILEGEKDVSDDNLIKMGKAIGIKDDIAKWYAEGEEPSEPIEQKKSPPPIPPIKPTVKPIMAKSESTQEPVKEQKMETQKTAPADTTAEDIFKWLIEKGQSAGSKTRRVQFGKSIKILMGQKSMVMASLDTELTTKTDFPKSSNSSNVSLLLRGGRVWKKEWLPVVMDFLNADPSVLLTDALNQDVTLPAKGNGLDESAQAFCAIVIQNAVDNDSVDRAIAHILKDQAVNNPEKSQSMLASMLADFAASKGDAAGIMTCLVSVNNVVTRGSV